MVKTKEDEEEIKMKINDNFLDILKAYRPKNSVQTNTGYMCSLRNIANGIGRDIMNTDVFVEYYEDIMDYLLTMAPNVRKTKISGIVVLLDNPDGNSEEVDEVLVGYRKQMFYDAKIVAKQEKKQQFSKKKEDNEITWAEVMKTYKKLETEVKPLWTMDDISKRQFFRLQDFVILSCYVLIAPRRSKDFCEFKIRDIDGKEDNYMKVPTRSKKKSSIFVFNKYKNANRLGPEYVPIPYVLKRIIDKWKAFNPYNTLFLNSKYNPLGVERLVLILNRIFGKKRISTTMLRNIYLTSKFDNVDLEDLEETAYNMGNNQITRILKYVKKKPKE